MKHTIPVLIVFILSAYTSIGQTTVTDYDGNVYNTVTIGTQIWMQKNLNVTHYRNGDTISFVRDSIVWMNSTTGTYCDYENKPTNSSVYGKLYNWYAVNTNNLCPANWHVPDESDWNTLELFLDKTVDISDTSVWTGTDIGNILKESGTAHWDTGNGGNNSSKFTAIPAGYRNPDGTFADRGHVAAFWSSSPYDSSIAWNRNLFYTEARILHDFAYKIDGLSVRCLMDSSANQIPDTMHLLKVSMYPNPCSDRLHIRISEEGVFQIRIYDLIGNCVFDQQSANKFTGIDVNSFSKGVYIVQFVFKTYTVQRKLTVESFNK